MWGWEGRRGRVTMGPKTASTTAGPEKEVTWVSIYRPAVRMKVTAQLTPRLRPAHEISRELAQRITRHNQITVVLSH